MWLAVYGDLYVLYTCIAVCAHASWEYILSLADDWTWGHGATAALPMSGCNICSHSLTKSLPSLQSGPHNKS